MKQASEGSDFRNAFEVFLAFARLGCTSFGGPVAHLGYFHAEFVSKRKWLDEHSYADLVALCQFLPGPASSQVGMAIGLSRAGTLGAFLAWLGFTLPSAVIMTGLAFGVSAAGFAEGANWLHGLKIAAVAIVAQALWIMGAKLCPDKERAAVAVFAAVTPLLFPSAFGQIAMIAFGAVIGLFFIRKSDAVPSPLPSRHLQSRSAALYLVVFFALLLLLPILARDTQSESLVLVDRFFRAGSLVFGGGHVVLPLLKSEIVNPGWVTANDFLAGYGAAQAIPGPLFTFTAYLGAISNFGPAGLRGAAICLLAAFLPSFLLVQGAMPFWERIRDNAKTRSAMLGINAAVVGLLLAAFYNPVWTSAIIGPKDFALLLACMLALMFWRWPSWAVVVGAACVGAWI